MHVLSAKKNPKRVRPGRESLAYTRITVLGKARRSERDEARRGGAKPGGALPKCPG